MEKQMERLTERFINKGISGVCLKALDYKGNIADNSLVLERLAEFEDFMEEQGFDGLQHLEFTLEEQNKIIEAYQQENQSLKDRWEKLKEYAEKHFEEEAASLAVAFRKILVKMQELEKE